MRLLLISNSTNAGEAYLGHPKEAIQEFLGQEPVTALFIPYAAVTFSYDAYEQKVQNRFREIGHDVQGIHHADDPVEAVKNAKAIVIGGGNTFHLLREMQKNKLVDIIRERVLDGVPYIGWSAGSNVACPTIRTTNDMPIVEPEGFMALNVIPFQINPHYLDTNPEGHAGETREMRIREFLVANPDSYVVGLREGTMLHIEDKTIELAGPRKARIFKCDEEAAELAPGDDFSFLLPKTS